MDDSILSRDHFRASLMKNRSTDSDLLLMRDYSATHRRVNTSASEPASMKYHHFSDNVKKIPLSAESKHDNTTAQYLEEEFLAMDNCDQRSVVYQEFQTTHSCEVSLAAQHHQAAIPTQQRRAFFPEDDEEFDDEEDFEDEDDATKDMLISTHYASSPFIQAIQNHNQLMEIVSQGSFVERKSTFPSPAMNDIDDESGIFSHQSGPGLPPMKNFHNNHFKTQHSPDPEELAPSISSYSTWETDALSPRTHGTIEPHNRQVIIKPTESAEKMLKKRLEESSCSESEEDDLLEENSRKGIQSNHEHSEDEHTDCPDSNRSDSSKGFFKEFMDVAISMCSGDMTYWHQNNLITCTEEPRNNSKNNLRDCRSTFNEPPSPAQNSRTMNTHSCSASNASGHLLNTNRNADSGNVMKVNQSYRNSHNINKPSVFTGKNTQKIRKTVHSPKHQINQTQTKNIQRGRSQRRTLSTTNKKRQPQPRGRSISQRTYGPRLAEI